MRAAAVWIMALILLVSAPAHAQRHKTHYGEFKIVIFGDSFSSGHGVEADFTYPVLLRDQINLSFEATRIEVINAAVTGDTTATGLARIGSILALKPDIVVVAFGATDALYKVDPSIIYNSLDQILHTLTYNNMYVLLAGFSAPQDAPIEYMTRFNSMYPELAKRYHISFVPNLLEGVEHEQPKLQFDSIHPNEEGSQVIADHLNPQLTKMIQLLVR